MFKLFTKLSFLWVILLGALAFGQISNRPSDDLVRRAMLQSAGDKVLTNEDLNYELTDFYTNTKNGIQHIYLRQSINELEVIGTESSIHISSTGKISHVNNKFTNSILKRVNNTDSTPQISQVQAVNYAAMHLGYPITQTLQLVSQANTADRKSVVSN